MSQSDDGAAEMTTSQGSTDDDAAAERLLRGRPVDGANDLATLVEQLRRLRSQPPAPNAALAVLLAKGFDPASTSAAADVPVWPAVPRRGLLRHPAARVAGLSLLAKIALGGGVAVAGVGSAAGAGVLPAVVQDRVAQVVGALTPFEVPSSTGNRSADEPGDPSDGRDVSERSDTGDAGQDDTRRDAPAPGVVSPAPEQRPVTPSTPMAPAAPPPPAEPPASDLPDDAPRPGTGAGPAQPGRPAEPAPVTPRGDPGKPPSEDSPVEPDRRSAVPGSTAMPPAGSSTDSRVPPVER